MEQIKVHPCSTSFLIWFEVNCSCLEQNFSSTAPEFWAKWSLWKSIGNPKTIDNTSLSLIYLFDWFSKFFIEPAYKLITLPIKYDCLVDGLLISSFWINFSDSICHFCVEMGQEAEMIFCSLCNLKFSWMTG